MSSKPEYCAKKYLKVITLEKPIGSFCMIDYNGFIGCNGLVIMVAMVLYSIISFAILWL